MRRYTPQELRSAVVVAVVVTAIAVLALLDPSCRPRTDLPTSGHHSIAP